MLIRNIILAFVAFFVFGVAAPASAKTMMEIDACKDAALMAAPFTGTKAQKERQAKSLSIGTKVLVDGEWVALTTGQSLWSLCEGPSLKEQLASANARITSLERENAILVDFAKAEAKRHAAALEAKDAKIKSEKSFGMLWLILGLFVLAVLVIMVLLFFRLWEDRVRLERRLEAFRQSAPPTDEPSTLGKVNDGPTPNGRGSEG